METSDEKRSRRVVSIPGLIGWLSVCLLAAAWGQTLDDRWQPIWAQVGAFGLVAAVGLGSLESARSAMNRWNHISALNSRLECGVARCKDCATIETINAGVRKLREYADEAHKRVRPSVRGPRRFQGTLLAHFPLQLTPVEERGAQLDPNAIEKMSGALRRISGRAIAFDHAERFATEIVLLEFQLGRQERLAFVVDVVWTERHGAAAGFMSGGTVLAVGVPDNADEDPAETAAEQTAALATAI